MGGSGGSYFTPIDNGMEQKLKVAQEKEKQKLISDVNYLLSDLLAIYNSRDKNTTNKYLDKIQDILGKEFEIDRILFGGSVAKHTEVDGLSDIDALVILNTNDIKGDNPKDLLKYFYDILNLKLKNSDDKKEIIEGKLAVTIIFKDNTEIQLLPAKEKENIISIASQDGNTWNDTKPKEFQKELTEANSQMRNGLIPAIKLFKSINSNLNPNQRLFGYHIEALAVEASKNYLGEKTPRALLLHLLDYASNRILKPIKDVTGQSKQIDSYLGKDNNELRIKISKSLSSIKRILDTSTNLDQWRNIFGVGDE
jgi:hypothetical protein